MVRRPLGGTGLFTAPLVLGGNVFGWTIDQTASFEVLDAFLDHGFNAIDTADVYSAWEAGNQGGESETIIGSWLKARPGVRDKVLLFTKVGSDMGGPDRKGLSRAWIARAIEDSLRRLQTDRIDVYFSHWPDEGVAYEETLDAFRMLIDAGKVRAIGASNLDAAQLTAALAVSKRDGLPAYQVLQPEYNLHDRGAYDGPLRDLCLREGLGVVAYFSLASGFLAGKYRSKADLSQSKRGEDVSKYFNERGFRILSALDQVSQRQGAEPAQVALAWLMSRRGVTAPIASATRPAHVGVFAKAAALELSAEDLVVLELATGEPLPDPADQ
jgi:aryl-alcohol dehydrogenase-like predicted oxidoreductase